MRCDNHLGRPCNLALVMLLPSYPSFGHVSEGKQDTFDWSFDTDKLYSEAYTHFSWDTKLVEALAYCRERISHKSSYGLAIRLRSICFRCQPEDETHEHVPATLQIIRSA